jgi:uncharacterized membrane protein YgcG
MDVVILCWLTNTISSDLQEVIRERDRTARHMWLSLENQFFDNHETRTLHLNAAFRTFVQGDLIVGEYCHKFKGMADALADLRAPVDDRILILNILRGLNQRFEHVGAIIRRYSSFLNFLKVRDDLLLEEIHLDTSGPVAAPTALYFNSMPSAPKPPPSTPSRTPGNGNNNRNKNNNRRHSGNGGGNSGNGGGNGGKNNNNGGGRGGNSGNTTAASTGSTNNDSKGTPPWLMYVHPWQ